MGIRREHLVGSLILILVFIGLFYLVNNSSSFIPQDIKNKLDFTAYLPSRSAPYSVDKSTFKYHQDKDPRSGAETNVLSYLIKNSGNKITITEQDFPTTLPYEGFVGTLNPYDSIGSALGKVTLTRPKRLNGQQTAVVYYNGTLVFATPDKDLSNDDWRSIFNSLEVVK